VVINFSCTKCGSTVFRIYVSRNLAECHQCLAKYELDKIHEIKIEHQR
jgi:hypothetical protein